MTDQKTPDGPQERLEGGSATPAPSEGPNGPQAGAQPRGPVDWARHYAAQRQQQAAAEPAPWSQLEARAFNAVQPALREAGEWLPLSARRKVARAVLAEILGPIPDSADTATWTAVRAIQLMNEAGQRRERAEAAIERVRQLCSPEQNTDQLGYLRRSRDVLAALDPQETP